MRYWWKRLVGFFRCPQREPDIQDRGRMYLADLAARAKLNWQREREEAARERIREQQTFLNRQAMEQQRDAINGGE